MRSRNGGTIVGAKQRPTSTKRMMAPSHRSTARIIGLIAMQGGAARCGY